MSEQSQGTWLTQEAYDRLSAELEHRKTTERKEIAQRVEAARQEGDLRENAGYHAAREEAGLNEARIIQLEETLENAQAFIAEQGYTFPVFFDQDADAARTYGAYSLPTTYFIDAEGNAVAQATGAIDRETLQTGIDMIYSPEAPG